MCRRCCARKQLRTFVIVKDGRTLRTEVACRALAIYTVSGAKGRLAPARAFQCLTCMGFGCTLAAGGVGRHSCCAVPTPLAEGKRPCPRHFFTRRKVSSRQRCRGRAAEVAALTLAPATMRGGVNRRTPAGAHLLMEIGLASTLTMRGWRRWGWWHRRKREQGHQYTSEHRGVDRLYVYSYMCTYSKVRKVCASFFRVDTL